MSQTPNSVAPKDLADSELFRDVSEQGRADAIRCASVRHWPKGAAIFEQDQPCERAHAVLSGRVRIAQSDADGGQLLVRFIGPGETYGTVGLFSGHRYPAQAIAAVDCVEISWAEAALRGLIERHPQIAINILKVAAERLRDVENRLRESNTQRVERRIAHTILRLAAKGGQGETGGGQIDFPLSRKDIADMCGATVHTVSRTLTQWEKEGWVSTNQQRLTLLNPLQIRRLAEEA